MARDGDLQEGEPLLRPAMRAGRRTAPKESLAQLRERAQRSLADLPERLRRLERGFAYPAAISPSLAPLGDETDRRQAISEEEALPR
jgi:nicotinate phosphoribosyltransferase